MSDEQSRILITAVILVAAAGLWAGGLILVYWDSARRELPGRQQIFWMLLALVPVLGPGVYLLASWLCLPGPAARPARPAPRAGGPTPLKPPEGRQQRLPTIAAADLAAHTNLVPQPAPAARRPAAPVALQLEVVDGPHRGRTFPLQALPLRLGRAAGTAVCLEGDLGISRQHAEIFSQNGQLYIRDLGSSHGTFVDDQRVTEAPLAAGSQIRLGHTLLALKPAAGEGA